MPSQPVGSGSPLSIALLPIAVVLGIVRVALLIVLIALWSLLVVSVGAFGVSKGRAVHVKHSLSGYRQRDARGFIHAFFGRCLLLVIGFSWIGKENVSLKSRG